MARLRSWTLFAFSTWVILIAVVFCSSPARAGIGFQPISQEELKMTSEPKAPGAPAIILYRQVDRDDNGKTSHEDNYIRIKILNDQGRKHADVEIPYDKELENVVHIRARTIRPDGSVSNFGGKVYDKTVVKAKDVKYLAKTFTLPEVQAGSIIEYTYTIDLSEEFIFSSHWVISRELFTKRAKLSLKPFTTTHQNIQLRWSGHDVPNVPQQGPDKVVRLEVTDVAAFQTEDYMPPENELKARVDFVYSEDTPDRDIAGFWKKTGKRLNGKMESFIGKRKAMEQAVSQIVSQSDSPEEKAQKIYAKVQQLRNTSFEVQRTEEEKKRDKEKAASNVEDVWNRGYGTGVQLTWLYLALTKAAGLEAYGTVVADRSNYFLSSESMDSVKLNSNVVLIRFKDKEVYCDPGAAFTPFGLLPWAETNVKGLRLDKDGGSWITTSLPESSASRIERKAELKIMAETGGVEGKLVVTYTGLDASSRRVEERNQDEAARKKFLEDEVKDSIPLASEVELVNKPEWKSSVLPLVAEFNVKVSGWVVAAGRRAMLPAGLFSAAEKHVFDHAQRVHPIYYRYLSTKLDDVTIELPAGWQVTSLPSATDEDLKAVAYAAKVVNDKSGLHLSRKLSTNFVLLDVEAYPALQRFYRMVRTNDEKQVVLLPGATTASK